MENETIKLMDLSFDELKKINGGETAWYWVAYGVGQFVRGWGAFSDGANPVGQGYPPR